MAKFRELKQYLDERGISKPLIGNVYLLGKRAARIMSEGRPPGCWISPELAEQIKEEVGTEDKGKAARLERAAHTVAVLRGLGYAGAYVGGTDDAEQIRWIISRGEELAPRWEEFAEELTYAPKNAFYIDKSPKRPPKRLGLIPNALNLAGKMFPVRTENRLAEAPAARVWLDRPPAVPRERRGKIRDGGEGPDVRLQILWQLRPGGHGVCVSANLSQADPQRTVWRHGQRPVRGHSRTGLHLGGRLRKGQGGRRTGNHSRSISHPRTGP